MDVYFGTKNYLMRHVDRKRRHIKIFLVVNPALSPFGAYPSNFPSGLTGDASRKLRSSDGLFFDQWNNFQEILNLRTTQKNNMQDFGSVIQVYLSPVQENLILSFFQELYFIGEGSSVLDNFFVFKSYCYLPVCLASL